MAPRTVFPSANCSSSLTRNHSPNCLESLMARHTRERGAASWTFFSMRSVSVFSMVPASVVIICNLRVALTILPPGAIRNPWVACCRRDGGMRSALRFVARPEAASRPVHGLKPVVVSGSSLSPGQQKSLHHLQPSRLGISLEKRSVLSPLLPSRPDRALCDEHRPQLSTGVGGRKLRRSNLVENR